MRTKSTGNIYTSNSCKVKEKKFGTLQASQGFHILDSMTTNRVLAGPLGDCCFDPGFKHEGTPASTKITIAGVPTYLSEPPKSQEGSGDDPPKVFIFLADVNGASWPNNLLLMDTFAQYGFTVLAVDYFLGDGVYLHTESDFDRDKWKDDMHTLARGIMPGWWEAVKKEYGREAKYCVAGYCFGAPYTMQLAADDVVVAAALAHPAFLNEDHFRNIKSKFYFSQSDPLLLKSLLEPLLLSCAETDHTFPTESRRIAEDILISNKANYYFQVFSGVVHGFANRGDPSIPDYRWAKEQSAQGISQWFHRFLDVSLAKPQGD
ncbi:hypothetical protein D9757_007499 [Collybiopsis confluens]|uniref:Dienelactone hydrolase domain-containing protein n=1 Tax=Collybiopsis confluens TaxID=2823264 RepID=A0A8H5M804_9AGAR|nr:hypothetical protein D9757_007499 [Collybiopsis confluens]